MTTFSAASDEKNVVKMTFPFCVSLADGLLLNSEATNYYTNQSHLNMHTVLSCFVYSAKSEGHVNIAIVLFVCNITEKHMDGF